LSGLLVFSGWLLRGVLAWLLVFASLFFAIAYLGVSSATTDASATQLYVSAGIYLMVSWAALAYCLLGTRERLRWALLLAPLSPVLVLAGLTAISPLLA
jgi:hypothetical protein